MSKTTTFEAWAARLPNGKLWTWLATAKIRVLSSRRAMLGHAQFEGRPEAKPVRVRVTVEVIEEGLTIPEAMDA